MKGTRVITATLLMAAFATIGCSKKSDTSKGTAASADGSHANAMTKPAAPSSAATVPGAANGATPINDSADAAITTPAITSSFGDGEAAYNAKKYGEALAIFEAYTQRRPHNAWGHYMLALSAWKHGDLAKSEGAFEKALSIDPRHIKSYVNLSRVLIDQERHDEAIERLTRAADIDPESSEVHRLLGRTYYAQGKTEETVDAYRRAIELNERDAWSLNNLGLVLIETRRPEEALPLLIQAVELRKDVAEFHNNLGLALEQTGHLSAAAAAYGGALRVNPGYDQAKQNLARVEPQ